MAAQEEGREQGLGQDHGSVLGVPPSKRHPPHKGDFLARQPRPAPGWLHGALLAEPWQPCPSLPAADASIAEAAGPSSPEQWQEPLPMPTSA